MLVLWSICDKKFTFELIFTCAIEKKSQQVFVFNFIIQDAKFNEIIFVFPISGIFGEFPHGY